MCGNFCEITEKNAIKSVQGCGSIHNIDVWPGKGFRWINTCGGGGRWEYCPEDSYVQPEPNTVTQQDVERFEREANAELDRLDTEIKLKNNLKEKLFKGPELITRGVYEDLSKELGWTETYEAYKDRVAGKVSTKNSETLENCSKKVECNKSTDVSYIISMTDEEMLEQLKKNAVENIMTKLPGQVVDLVDDAIRTVMSDFERSKEARDACGTKTKPQQDFAGQWVKEMMEKQIAQNTISVVNEMLHQKEYFVKFLKECSKSDTYSDFIYKTENEIKRQENEIDFYKSYLEQFYKNN